MNSRKCTKKRRAYGTIIKNMILFRTFNFEASNHGFKVPILSAYVKSTLSRLFDVSKALYIHQSWSGVTKNASQITSKTMKVKRFVRCQHSKLLIMVPAVSRAYLHKRREGMRNSDLRCKASFLDSE